MPREGRKFDRSEVFMAFRYKDMARRVLGVNDWCYLRAKTSSLTTPSKANKKRGVSAPLIVFFDLQGSQTLSNVVIAKIMS